MSVRNEFLRSDAAMTAVGIDIRTSLALGRAALKGVCALSPQARAVVLEALADEAAAAALDDGPESAAVVAVIGETRRALASE